MVGHAAKNFRLVVALGLVALCAGCFEDKTTVTVHSNGAGTVHVSRTFTEEFTKKNYAGKSEAEMQASASQSFLQTLKGCQGIVAWSSASGKVEGGHLIQDAVGYFEDVNKLKLTDVMGDAPKTQPFVWKKNADGGFTMTWASFQADDDGGKTFDKPRPTPEQVKTDKEGAQAYKGLSFERTFVMPGPITTKDAGVKDRSITMKTTFDDVMAFNDFVEGLWTKIDKKETTKEAATAVVKEKIQKVALAMQVTCGPAADAAEIAAFEKDLAKAKASYAGSELQKKIEGK